MAFLLTSLARIVHKKRGVASPVTLRISLQREFFSGSLVLQRFLMLEEVVKGRQ